MSEKKLRKRVEDTELKDYGLRETALEEQAPEESAAEDFAGGTANPPARSHSGCARPGA